MSEFSNRLDSLLVKNKMRRSDLVRATGINESTIRNWNLEGRIPSVDNAVKIASFFHISVEELWTGVQPESLNLSSSEIELINLCRQLDKKQFDNILDIVQMIVKGNSKV